MAETKIRFIGPEYDGAEAELGTFEEKLVKIVKDFAGQKYGEETVKTPSDIEIAPIAIGDDRIFVIRSWLETAALNGSVNITQPIEGSFDIEFDSSDGYLHHMVENGSNYKLTTVETIIMTNLGRLAAYHDGISSPMSREIT